MALNDLSPCNAECAYCQQGLRLRGDGAHPTARVAGSATALVSCNYACLAAWEHAHCAFCGQTPETTTLTVSIGGNQYCNVEHARAAGSAPPLAAVT